MSLLFSTGAIAGSAAKGAPGMVLITPTSIAHSGTSASIGANGQVTFTAVTSLSLNGVFSADFDNYVMAIRGVAGGSPTDVSIRFRVSGSDNSTANSYVYQNIEADSTTVAAGRTTNNIGTLSPISTTARSGATAFFYGPFLTQPTAWRSVAVNGSSSAYVIDYAGTHNQSTSYDGFTLTTTSPRTITGTLTVMGVRS